MLCFHLLGAHEVIHLKKSAKFIHKRTKMADIQLLVLMFSDCTTSDGLFVLFVVYIYNKDYDCIDFVNVNTSLL